MARIAMSRVGYRLTPIPDELGVPQDALVAQGVDGAGSHVPVLAAVVARTVGQGPVLALGMGDYSTPMLHLLCHDRLLVSADGSDRWVARYSRFRSARHELHLVSDWDGFDLLEGRRWAVAFVDRCLTADRAKLIARLQGHARFVVVHGAEADADATGGIDGVLNRFRFRSDYRVFRPFTTVVSDEMRFELTGAEATG
jgi:hypothetical protein